MKFAISYLGKAVANSSMDWLKAMTFPLKSKTNSQL